MTLGIDEYVLGLQVAVCDTFLLVQELKYQDDFGGIELGGGLVEASGSS